MIAAVNLITTSKSLYGFNFQNRSIQFFLEKGIEIKYTKSATVKPFSFLFKPNNFTSAKIVANKTFHNIENYRFCLRKTSENIPFKENEFKQKRL